VYIASKVRIISGNELIRMRKEAVMSLFELPYGHLLGRTEEDHEESRSGKVVKRRTGHPATKTLTA
jgi:hypothetical protein